MNFIVIIVSSLPGNKDCVAVYEKTCTLWDNVVLATASLILKQVVERCFISQCSLRLWATCSNLKAFLGYLNYPQINSIVVSYRCHSTRNLVLLQSSQGPQTGLRQATDSCACPSFGRLDICISQQSRADVSRTVCSQFTVHQCTVCQSGVGGSSFCLFRSSLTICLRCV